MAVTFKPNQAQSENEGNFLDFHDVRNLPEDEVSIRRSMSEAALTSPSSSGSDQDGAQSSRFWIPSSLSSQTEDAWSGDCRNRQHDRCEREGRSSRSGSAYSGSSG
jgi:hypothetical protein